MFLQMINERRMSAGSEPCTQQLAVGASNFRLREEADFCDEVDHMLSRGQMSKNLKCV